MCTADAADAVFPGAVGGAYRGVLSWEDLQEPVRRLVLAGSFAFGEEGQGWSSVTGGQDADVTLFDALFAKRSFFCTTFAPGETNAFACEVKDVATDPAGATLPLRGSQYWFVVGGRRARSYHQLEYAAVHDWSSGVEVVFAVHRRCHVPEFSVEYETQEETKDASQNAISIANGSSQTCIEHGVSRDEPTLRLQTTLA